MKFYCDACSTKYAISDEKVRGKVLKVRCKNCSAIITVREAQKPVQQGPSSSSAVRSSQGTPRVPTTQWYYALNGQTFGPFTLAALREKYSRAELSDATYVWHADLVDWKPVTTVDAFKAAVASGHKISPRRKTLGFSGELQAVQVEDRPAGPQSGSVPDEVSRPPAKPAGPAETQVPAKGEAQAPRRPARPKPAEPKPSRPSARPSIEAPSPESRPVGNARRDKLERLRARLNDSDEEAGDEDAAAQPSAIPRPSAQESSPAAKTSAAPAKSARKDEESLPKPVGGEATFTFADGVTPASAKSSQELATAEAPREPIDFGLPPAVGASTPSSSPSSSPSSGADLLDSVIGPTEPDPPNGAKPIDSGVIEFPSGPGLGSPAPEPASSQTSGSLLIQIDQIKKEGRGKRWILVTVVGLLTLSISGVAIFFALNQPQEQKAQTVTPKQEHKDELVIPTYGKSEVGKLATMELEDEMLFGEEEGAQEPAKDETKPAESAKKTEKKAAATKTSEPAKSSGAAAKKKTTAENTKTKAAATEEQASAEPEEESDDIYKALLSSRAGKTSPTINAPPDKLSGKGGGATGLTKDQARRGFQRVKRSVRDCRERHNRHNARLEAGKIKLSVTVQPNGRVSKFDVTPRSVQNTEFERCMQSHKGRWSFAAFSGKEVVINTSIIMQ